MSVSSQSKLPEPKDLSHHLSRATRSRQASNIKQFYKYFSIPGIGQLAGGLPNPNYFPYDTLEAKVALPDRFKPTPNKPVDLPSAALAATSLSDSASLPSSNVLVPHASGTTDPLRKIDLASALQYGTAQGYPPLYYFIRQFTRENLHPNVPYAGGPEIILTVGSTDGFSKALQALSNEWSEEKDWIREREGLLVEEFAYMNAVQAARPRGLNIVPVAIDDEGMKATGKGGLEDVLKNWDYTRGKRPHLMYTVTIGQNPTAGTLSLARRKDIIALCNKYDIIIVEDDPYWYLQYPSAANKKAEARAARQNDSNTVEHAEKIRANFRTHESARSTAPALSSSAPQKSSGYDFLDSLVPSYLSVDTEGRVVRLDTFSKTVAPGCRLGWITAQPALIERILRITETSTQQPSGFVQAMIAELIMGPQSKNDGGQGGAKDGSGWKVDGWVRWLEGLRGNYERRMNAMCQILEDGQFLVKAGRRNSLTSRASSSDDDEDEWAVVEKTQMYAFDWPLGGMFIWLHINFPSHPLFKKVEPARLSHALWILWTTKPFLVLASPGNIFSPTSEIAQQKGWQFFRLCFAACDEELLAPISKRLVEGVAAFWRIKDVRKIEELLKDEETTVDARCVQMMGPC
ncbi:hypothetical protein LTR04_006665 [Oleoguttula sp. CCFEE 6159]|nr:hypothetical protein LTR04_006665 [Oleoguttula sp. CCFEE 6159]